MHSAPDGGEWSASRFGRLTRRERATFTHLQEVGWALEPVWTRWRREKFPAAAGNRTSIVHPVV